MSRHEYPARVSHAPGGQRPRRSPRDRTNHARRHALMAAALEHERHRPQHGDGSGRRVRAQANDPACRDRWTARARPQLTGVPAAREQLHLTLGEPRRQPNRSDHSTHNPLLCPVAGMEARRLCLCTVTDPGPVLGALHPATSETGTNAPFGRERLPRTAQRGSARLLRLRETGSERSVSQRSLARPDPGIAGAGCEGVADVAGHGLA